MAGSIIVSDAVYAILIDPVVYDQLPLPTRAMIDPILKKDKPSWTTRDKKDLGIALAWSLQNIK
jgi:hypothetical protein